MTSPRPSDEPLSVDPQGLQLELERLERQQAVERERTRTLPYEEVRLLKDAGFGALRVPVEFGGFGATLRQSFALLIKLAAADSNLPQALRATARACRE